MDELTYSKRSVEQRTLFYQNRPFSGYPQADKTAPSENALVYFSEIFLQGKQKS